MKYNIDAMYNQKEIMLDEVDSASSNSKEEILFRTCFFELMEEDGEELFKEFLNDTYSQKKQKRKRIYRIAGFSSAAAVILILILSYFFILLKPTVHTNVAVNENPNENFDNNINHTVITDNNIDSETNTNNAIENSSENTPDNSNSIEETSTSANFVELQSFEGLIGQNKRYKNHFKILSPDTGIEIENNVLSIHYSTSFTETLTLKIFNNKEQLLITKELLQESNQIDVPLNLNSGLYYWKIETVDKLVYLNKFFIPQE